MIISAIKTDKYTYVNIHAEEVVTSNYLENDNSGIYGRRLQIITLNRIFEHLDKDTQRNIILDFNHIERCQPNLNKTLIDLKNKGYKLAFINLRKTVCDELSLSTVSNTKTQLEGDVYSRFFFFENDKDDLTEIECDVPALFNQTFKEKLIPFIESHGKPHTSSYVYLTSYVDIKKFLSYEREFMLFAIYKLALKIEKEWSVEIDKDPILICQSMNSAFIVSVLSNLLKLDILILDKIGPINKLYTRVDKTIVADRKYIVVSDLVCLGTEVKIVKTLIQFIGGKYLGNVSIIKTETLSKADIKREEATIAVFSINRSNNKELKYSITTDLEAL